MKNNMKKMRVKYVRLAVWENTRNIDNHLENFNEYDTVINCRHPS